MKDYTSNDFSFEQLVKIKILNKERLMLKKDAWLDKYEALSLDEKIILDKKFGEAFQKIAAEFGRNRPFPSKGNFPLSCGDGEKL